MERTVRRKVQGITVDNLDTKDRDDAIWLEPQADGGCIVHVSIADVAARVSAGSDIDIEARRRGFSRYLATKTVYMLPRNLTLDSCSLDAGRVRDTVTITIRLDTDLQAVSCQVYLSQLRSLAQLSYGEADRIAQQPDHQLSAMLSYGFALTSRLLQARREKGALAIYDLRNGWYTDEDGELIRYEHDELHRSHVLIQELMILANRVLAEQAIVLNLPQIFRNHQARNAAPAATDLAAEIQQALSHPGLLSLETLQQRVKLVVGRANYGTVVSGHYGLSLAAYAHMTSPIRRYVDLVNWRIWHAHLRGQPLPYHQDELKQIAEEMTAIQEARRPKPDQRHQQRVARQYDVEVARNSLVNRPAGDLHKLLKLRCQEGALDPQLEEAVLIRLNRGTIRPKSLYYILEAQASDFDRLKAAIWQHLDAQPGLAVSLFDIINAETGLKLRSKSYSGAGDGRFYFSASIDREGQILQTPLAGGKTLQAARHKSAVWLLRLYYHLDIPSGDIPAGQVMQLEALSMEASKQVKVEGNPKQQLAELCQQLGLAQPVYATESSGASHRPVFETQVSVNVDQRQLAATGEDSRKKQSEQRAALGLLEQLRTQERLIDTQATSLPDTTNYVGMLMERAVARGWPLPAYEVVRSGGGDHLPQFSCTVTAHTDHGRITETAIAPNKQEAKRQAAKLAYNSLAG